LHDDWLHDDLLFALWPHKMHGSLQGYQVKHCLSLHICLICLWHCEKQRLNVFSQNFQSANPAPTTATRASYSLLSASFVQWQNAIYLVVVSAIRLPPPSNSCRVIFKRFHMGITAAAISKFLQRLHDEQAYKYVRARRVI
jgi:hypothetical protein